MNDEPENKPKETELRDLLTGKKPFAVAMRQTSQRDHYEVVTGDNFDAAKEGATAVANGWAAKGNTAFVLVPLKVLQPPKEPTVEESELAFE